jgi:plastocyanin
VKWVWKGKIAHNVTVTRGPVKFKSGTKAKGTYSKRLTRAGIYTIVCTIHPGMKMTLKVR